MWVAVTFYNPALCLMALCVLKDDSLLAHAVKGDLLSEMGLVSPGEGGSGLAPCSSCPSAAGAPGRKPLMMRGQAGWYSACRQLPQLRLCVCVRFGWNSR
jgi:hypothetical protein